MSGLLIRLNRLTEAMTHYRTALEIEEKLSQAEPASDESRDAPPIATNIGIVFNKQGRFAEALALDRQKVEPRERSATGDPRDARSRSGVGVGLFLKRRQAHPGAAA